MKHKDFDIGEYVFDTASQKIVQIAHVWTNGRVVVYTVKWLKPEHYRHKTLSWPMRKDYLL
jgi:hypothetical protein